jgi:tRNA 2-thiouridine synthesizing protein D
MKYGILILDGPYNHQASDSAYNFIKAAMDKGHEIAGIFFYNDGVLNSNKHIDPPADDRNIANRWKELGATGIDIVICIAAAKRRGITDDAVLENTRISGLGQLVDMTLNADRMLTFGS